MLETAGAPLLPVDATFAGAFPRLSRRLRAGIVGGGRIARIQAMGARLSDYWEVAAGALSSDPAAARARAAEWYLPAERAYASFEAMAEAEAERPDGIDAVVITTPNDGHYAVARAFLEAGIDVICDKPLTNTLDEALDLVRLAQERGLVFGVCHAFAAFPMVRQAREMVQAGALGRINQVHVEYLQDALSDPRAAEAKHVQWRLDPARAGPTSCTGDIGTHAHHVAGFVTGLEMTALRADLHVCGAPKALDDTVIMTTRFAGDVPGTLLATRVAPGQYCGLRLRIYGDEGGLEWDQEHAEFLRYTRLGESPRLLSRGPGGGIGPAAARFTRLGRATAEGWIEAWANLYSEFALAIAARRDGRSLPPDLLAFPTVVDGARGVRFIEAAVQSHRQGGVWVDCSLATRP
jgi:predicted dehydrogenase